MDNVILRCEDEPIHIPSFIQPIGYFFAIDSKTYEIKYISENIIDISSNVPQYFFE